MKLPIDELKHIVNDCVPIENGFLDEETGEIFTAEEMNNFISDLDSLVDFLGMEYLEAVERAKARGELEKRYKESKERENKRAENLQFFIGYLTDGQKKKYKHVNVSFYYKQERLKFYVPDSKVPDKFKRDKNVRVVDNDLIRAALEKGDPALEGIAKIDTRKKATIK